MIASANRFHGHNSLNYVYRHGAMVRGPLTSLRYVTNDRRSTYRLAVVVSKKVSKSAVVRNRIRRRIYEVARLLESHVERPYDVVVTVFSESLLDLSHEDLRKLVNAQYRQAGMIDAREGKEQAPKK